MANQIIGRVFYIGDTNSIKSKDGSKTYYKRELVLDATRFDGLTGQRGYDNFPSIEFNGDNCHLLDQLKMGDVVTVSFDLQGTKYEKDGQTRFFTSIRGYKVEPKQVYQPAQPQTPQPQTPQPPVQQPYYPPQEDNTPF
nr:MAG TPA: Single-strand binding protein, single stranded DNA-binding protein.3A [Caudoviricetes sp.]